MILVRDPQNIEQEAAEAMIITGDGKNEIDRLRAIVPKFDHEDKLIFPHGSAGKTSALSTIVGKQSTTDTDSRSGFDALRAVDTYQGKRNMWTRLRSDGGQKYLFICDKEDINGGNLYPKIKDTIESIADSPQSIDICQLGDQAFKSSLTIGSKDTVVYCAFTGDETGCFEDGLATLLSLREGIEITADGRGELKGKLSDHLGSACGDDLLFDSHKWQIKEAFPNICEVLSEFE